uniref:Uncharacterized protein n=1 Tax=Arundo donax TaxID=35708 RepID=A0A0A9DM39_ARUDO
MNIYSSTCTIPNQTTIKQLATTQQAMNQLRIRRGSKLRS